MAYFDLPLDQLKEYRPDRNEPSDFDSFWAQTLAEARSIPLDPKFTPIDSGLTLIDVFDVTYPGFGGQPIKGWFLIPKQRSHPLPCVVEFVGYGGGRGLPHENLLWSAAYNHYASTKQIQTWQYNNHEGGQAFQDGEKMRFLKHYSRNNHDSSL